MPKECSVYRLSILRSRPPLVVACELAVCSDTSRQPWKEMPSPAFRPSILSPLLLKSPSCLDVGQTSPPLANSRRPSPTLAGGNKHSAIVRQTACFRYPSCKRATHFRWKPTLSKAARSRLRHLPTSRAGWWLPVPCKRWHSPLRWWMYFSSDPWVTKRGIKGTYMRTHTPTGACLVSVWSCAVTTILIKWHRDYISTFKSRCFGPGNFLRLAPS